MRVRNTPLSFDRCPESTPEPISTIIMFENVYYWCNSLHIKNLISRLDPEGANDPVFELETRAMTRNWHSIALCQLYNKQGSLLKIKSFCARKSGFLERNVPKKLRSCIEPGLVEIWGPSVWLIIWPSHQLTFLKKIHQERVFKWHK